jgi:DNA-binding CsgD family transcriptional regulator
MDAMVGPVAILNARGDIVAVNKTWHIVAMDGAMADDAHGIGRNCIEICEQARGPWSDGASEVGAGLRDVLDGTRDSFMFTYPCPHDSEPVWFKLLAAPLRDQGRIIGAVAQHVDITRHDVRGLELLTPRERMILMGVVQGLSNKAIARRDRVSESAVKLHLRNIFAKLDVTNRTQAAMLGEHLMMQGVAGPLEFGGDDPQGRS